MDQRISISMPHNCCSCSSKRCRDGLLLVLSRYQDRLFDLLGPTAAAPDDEPSTKPFKRPELEIFEDKTNNIAISNAKKETVTSVRECQDVIAQAWNNRRTGCTDMNSHSSRSHCLILLSIGSYEVRTKTGRFAQMYLVDLAGTYVCSCLCVVCGIL